jgi:hypothetical protein
MLPPVRNTHGTGSSGLRALGRRSQFAPGGTAGPSRRYSPAEILANSCVGQAFGRLKVGFMTFRLAAGAALCAAVITAAGCSTGASANHPSAAAGQSQVESAAHAISLAAVQAKNVSSYSATVQIQSTGSAASTISGTVQMQMKPSLLIHQKLNITGRGPSVDGGLEAVLTSDTVFLKMSSLGRLLGKPWIKMSIAALSRVSGVNLGQLIQQAQGNNPFAQAQMLAAAKDVHQVGTQVINGVQTTEYTGTYSVATGLNNVVPSQRAQVRQYMKAAGITSIQFHTWIDAQHHVRKMTLLASGNSIRETIVYVITMINQPVHVRFPAASQLARVPNLP